MPKKISPLAIRRGPKPLSRQNLIRRVKALLAKRKRKHTLPSIKLWPGQVKAGIAALKPLLWEDPNSSTRNLIYPSDHEKVVRAVFKACIEARNERARKLRQRKYNPKWTEEMRAKVSADRKAWWAKRKSEREQLESSENGKSSESS